MKSQIFGFVLVLVLGSLRTSSVLFGHLRQTSEILKKSGNCWKMAKSSETHFVSFSEKKLISVIVITVIATVNVKILKI